MPSPLSRTRLPALALLAAVLLPVGTAAATGRVPAAVAPAARFSWPLAPPHPVLRRFTAPATPWGPGHRGVDLGGTPGEAVFAVADGIVAFAGPLVDRDVISIDHAGGLRSTYEPVDQALAAGAPVTRGNTIGHLRPGHPDCPGAPACLHWGIRRGAEYLDPLTLVTRHHIRLLPWRGPP